MRDMSVLRTCYALTMRYARAMHVPCLCTCTYHAICTCFARAMHLQCNIRALCTSHACAPARAPARIPCDMHMLRRCYALTMKYSSMHALCTCNACAPARTMRYERVLRTRYALTMQQSRAVHVPCICSCTYHAISTCSARNMHL